MGKRVNFLLDPSHLIPTSQWRNSGQDLKIETFLETVTAHNTDRHATNNYPAECGEVIERRAEKRIRMEISEVNRLLNEFSSIRQPSLHRMSKDGRCPTIPSLLLDLAEQCPQSCRRNVPGRPGTQILTAEAEI
jgi:hypothetical protein